MLRGFFFSGCLALLIPFSIPSLNAYDYCTDSCDRFFVEADWLYWKAKQDKLGFSSFTTQTTQGTATTANATLLEQHFKYESGFRTNIGYRPACSCWEVGLGFTYIPSHSNFSEAITGPNQFISTYNNNIGLFKLTDNLPFDTVDSKWHLHLYYIDLDVAYCLTFCDCIYLRPHIGIRYLNFREHLSANLESVTTRGGITATDDFSFKQREHGIGLEAGLGMNWDIGCGLSLNGHFGGSILYANYRINGRLDQSISSVEITTQLNNSYRSHIKTALPVVDYFLGVAYSNSICDISYFIEAGWEQFVLFDANRMALDGNLSLQGLTLRGGFAF